MAAGDILQGPPSQTGVATPGANTTDLVTALQGIIRQLTAGNSNTQLLVAAIQAAFPQIVKGTFTCAAAASTSVPLTVISSGSRVLLQPANAAAATLIGSVKSLYITVTAGVGFTVSTANGGNAAGTELFGYLVVG
jgi:hypothetical protein